MFLVLEAPAELDARYGSETLGRSSPKPAPRVYTPTRPRPVRQVFPWRRNIVTTIFWIGEKPTARNPTPNNKSSWDPKWAINYGGYDDPDPKKRSRDFRPMGFEPKLNPFYVALPYNDVATVTLTKPEASRVIPWFKRRFKRHGKTVCKSQWVAIRYRNRVCYAQWEDCGPYHTDDWEYVFKGKRPRNRKMNGGAALDVSPAVRDFLKMPSGARCDWRFVTLREIRNGPWCRYGENNHFVQLRRLREQRRAGGRLSQTTR